MKSESKSLSTARVISARVSFGFVFWLGGAVHTAYLPGNGFWDGVVWLYYVGRALAKVSVG